MIGGLQCLKNGMMLLCLAYMFIAGVYFGSHMKLSDIHQTSHYHRKLLKFRNKPCDTINKIVLSNNMSYNNKRQKKSSTLLKTGMNTLNNNNSKKDGHLIAITNHRKKNTTKKAQQHIKHRNLSNFHPKTVKVSIDGRHDFHNVPCDIPCKWTKGGNIMTRAKILDFPGKNTLLMSMEGPKHYHELVNKGNHALLCTTDFDSDIMMNYFVWDWPQYHAPEPKTEAEKFATGVHRGKPKPNPRPKILFLARNCKSLNNRERLVIHFQNENLLHSLSSCLNNFHDPDLDKKMNKVEFMGKYMFYAAFENERSNGYITEKLWGALASGSLPIYFGAPNIMEEGFLPDPKSIINYDDFKNLTALTKYIRYLINNRTAYMEHFQWKYRPLSEAFKRKWNFSHVHSACRVCRWVTAKRMGLQWDHDQQNIIHIPIEKPITNKPIVGNNSILSI